MLLFNLSKHENSFLCISKDVPLVEFMYLVLTCMSSESYCRWLRSLLLCWCDIFRALINSLVEIFSMTAETESGWKSNGNTENLFKTHYRIIIFLCAVQWKLKYSGKYEKTHITVHTQRQSHTMFTYIQPHSTTFNPRSQTILCICLQHAIKPCSHSKSNFYKGSYERWILMCLPNAISVSVVLSQLDYCKSCTWGIPCKQLWCPASPKHSCKDWHFRKREHITPILKELHW